MEVMSLLRLLFPESLLVKVESLDKLQIVDKGRVISSVEAVEMKGDVVICMIKNQDIHASSDKLEELSEVAAHHRMVYSIVQKLISEDVLSGLLNEAMLREKKRELREEMVEYYKAHNVFDESKPIKFTCDDCATAVTCRFSFDAYNTDGDCLASK